VLFELNAKLLLEEAEDSAAKPPDDETDNFDPKVDPSATPKALLAFGRMFLIVVVLSCEKLDKPPSVDVAPKAGVFEGAAPNGDEVVPPNDAVAPKIDELGVAPDFLLNSANGEILLVEGFPKVRPVEVPDPKAVDPVMPKEKPDLVGDAVSSEDDKTDGADPSEAPTSREEPDLTAGSCESSTSDSAAVLLSSTTTHEFFSPVGDARVAVPPLAVVSSESLGRSEVDPKAAVVKKEGSLIC